MKKMPWALLLVLLILFGWYFLKQIENTTNNNIPINTQTKPNPPKIQKTQNKIPNEPLKPFLTTLNKSEDAMPIIDDEIEESTEETSIPKEVLEDLQSRMTTQMKEIPNCLELATTKEEALACNKELRELNYELTLLLGNEAAIDAQNPQVESNFTWDETTKENMINELDSGIVVMQEMFSCLANATTPKEQQKCFEVEVEEIE